MRGDLRPDANTHAERRGTNEQIAEFLKGSEGIKFSAQNRAELYDWVQRRHFPVKYASSLLAAVDCAHGWLSGPGTLRIMKREHEQFGMISISASFIFSRRSQWTIYRL